jgi:hypothetical protein
MLLVRDPYGATTYSGDWRHDDSANWSVNAKTEAKDNTGLDPTSTANVNLGLFVMPLDDSLKSGSNGCFDRIQIVH